MSDTILRTRFPRGYRKNARP